MRVAARPTAPVAEWMSTRCPSRSRPRTTSASYLCMHKPHSGGSRLRFYASHMSCPPCNRRAALPDTLSVHQTEKQCIGLLHWVSMQQGSLTLLHMRRGQWRLRPGSSRVAPTTGTAVQCGRQSQWRERQSDPSPACRCQPPAAVSQQPLRSHAAKDQAGSQHRCRSTVSMFGLDMWTLHA